MEGESIYHIQFGWSGVNNHSSFKFEVKKLLLGVVARPL